MVCHGWVCLICCWLQDGGAEHHRQYEEEQGRSFEEQKVLALEDRKSALIRALTSETGETVTLMMFVYSLYLVWSNSPGSGPGSNPCRSRDSEGSTGGSGSELQLPPVGTRGPAEHGEGGAQLLS